MSDHVDPKDALPLSSVQKQDVATVIAKTTFGMKKSERYLTDTLNKLQKPKITAKCMKMISTQRGWCTRMFEAWGNEHLTAHELAHIVRLHKTEFGQYCSRLNKELDEELGAWESLLTDDGYLELQLKCRALKLAMNISTGCLKDLAERLAEQIVAIDAQEKRVRSKRSSCPIDTAKYQLPIAKELALIKDIAMFEMVVYKAGCTE